MREPVSLVDCFPTIIAGAGPPVQPDDRCLPGANLLDVVEGHLAAAHRAERIPCRRRRDRRLSHPQGSFKYVHYAGMPPQLFDLDADPQETRDLASEPD